MEKIHNFEDSVKLGVEKEDIFEEKLNELGIEYKRPKFEGQHEADFVLFFEGNPLPIKVDVKNDDVAQRTGNLAFETYSVYPHKHGWFVRPSAHVYVIFVGEDVYVFSREDFSEIIHKFSKALLMNTKIVRNEGFISLINTIPLRRLQNYRAKNLEHAIRQIEGIARNITILNKAENQG